MAEKQTILVADDEPEIRDVLRMMLGGEGYRILEASNAREAVEQAEKADLVILDIMMPGESGVWACEQIREKTTVPVLFLTAKSGEHDKVQGFSAGGDDYLVKPFSDEKLKEVVTKAVHAVKRSSRLEKDEKYIMVQTAGSHIKIFLRDIVYAEVFNRKVIIHTRNTDIEYYGKLQDLQNMAGEDFFRTHRAYLVHFKYVEKYDATCVTMKNGTALIAKQN